MKILIDTNIILDIMLERQPFFELAKRLMQTAQQADMEMFLTATTITDLYYITRKAKGKEIALTLIEDLLQFVEIAAVDKRVIVQALRSEIADFEDAVQDQAAMYQGIDIIVTRNKTDFRASELVIHTPESFLRVYPLGD